MQHTAAQQRRKKQHDEQLEKQVLRQALGWRANRVTRLEREQVKQAVQLGQQAQRAVRRQTAATLLQKRARGWLARRAYKRALADRATFRVEAMARARPKHRRA